MLGKVALGVGLFASITLGQTQLQTVMAVGDPDPSDGTRTLGIAFPNQHIALNNQGTVAFFASSNATDGSPQVIRTYRWRNGQLTSVGNVEPLPGNWNYREYGINVADDEAIVFGSGERYKLWTPGLVSAVPLFEPGMILSGFGTIVRFTHTFRSSDQGGLCPVLLQPNLITANLSFATSNPNLPNFGIVQGWPGSYSQIPSWVGYISTLSSNGRVVGQRDFFDQSNQWMGECFITEGRQTDFSQILASGATFPELPEGVTLWFLSALASNNSSGDFVDVALLRGQGTQPGNREAILARRNGEFHILAREGDPLAGVDGAPTVVGLSTMFDSSSSDHWAIPAITDTGIIAFFVELQYAGESDTRTAIVLDKPNGVRTLVLRSGDPLPGEGVIPKIANLQTWGQAKYYLNQHGQVAAIMSLYNSLPTSFPYSVIITDAQGNPHTAIRTDASSEYLVRGQNWNCFQLGFSSFSLDNQYPLTTGGADGNTRIFSDRGEFPLWALFRRNNNTENLYAIVMPQVPPGCDSIDFNNDGSVLDPQDLEAFLSSFGEGPCIPLGAACNDIDFNNDGSLFDPCDIDSFLRVFSEGPCTPCGT